MRINYEILDIRAYLTLIELGSFHSAADKLNMSQPAFSRRIALFEKKLGTRLFERTTRKVTPTLIAQQLQPVFARILADLEAASSYALSPRRGRDSIVVACVFSAAVKLLPSLIDRFLETTDNVEFTILDVSASAALEAVATGDAHFGITLLAGSYPTLKFIPIVKDPFVLLCHKNHPLAAEKRLSLEKLVGHRLIQFPDASYNRTIIDMSANQMNVDLDWLIKVSHMSTAIGMVDAGLGASIMPKMMAESANSPNLVYVVLHKPSIHRSVGIAEKKGIVLTASANDFRNFVNNAWPE